MDTRPLFWSYIYNAYRTGLYYKILQDKTLALKTDKQKHEGFTQSNTRTVLLYSCAQTRREITNCFQYKSSYTKKEIFTEVYLCTCTHERSFIGPYICYLHPKNMHYFWRMNITKQTWLLLFAQFLFSTQTPRWDWCINQQMMKQLLGTFMK